MQMIFLCFPFKAHFCHNKSDQNDFTKMTLASSIDTEFQKNKMTIFKEAAEKMHVNQCF